jgi:hypothetical protein
MIDPHQLHFCLVEIDKLAMPGALARAGIGATIGAVADGGPAAMHALRGHRDVARLRASGVLSEEQEKGFTTAQKLHTGAHVLRGALAGAAGGVALPHAAAAVKKYSGEAAQHLGREFGRGAAEHAAPAARAAMHEVAEGTPEVLDHLRRHAPDIGAAAARGAARNADDVGAGVMRGAKDALTPAWVGNLKEHAARLMREE